MGNNISASLEQGFDEVCRQLENANESSSHASAADAALTTAILQWSSPPLAQEQITRFTTALQANASLTRLVLRDLDTLEENGMRVLVQAVQLHASLRTLCFFGRLPRDWEVWGSALANNGNLLCHLELEECTLSAQTIQGLHTHFLANPGAADKLQSLRLVDIRVPASDLALVAQSIAQSTANLTTLQIGLKPPDMEAYPDALQHLATYLRNNHALRHLQLSGCLLDNGISILLPTKTKAGDTPNSKSSLEHLTLQGRGVTDESMESLGQFLCNSSNNIKVLDVSQSRLTGDGLATLWPAVQKLQTMSLAYNFELGNAGMIQGLAMAQSSSSGFLAELDLVHTGIQATGLAALDSALVTNNHKLQRLKLGEPLEVGWGHAEVLALVQLLQHNSTLLELDMAHAAFAVPESTSGGDDSSGSDDYDLDQHDEETNSFENLVQAVGSHPTLQQWSIQCRSTAQVMDIIQGLPRLQQNLLTKLALHIAGGPRGLQWTPAMGESMLAKLHEALPDGVDTPSKCLREIHVLGLRGGQEAAWKIIQPQIQQFLTSSSNCGIPTTREEESHKRPVDEEDKASDKNKRTRVTD